MKEEGTTPSHCNEAGAELKKTKEKRLGQPQHTTAQMCGRPPPTAGSITTNTTTPLGCCSDNRCSRNRCTPGNLTRVEEEGTTPSHCNEAREELKKTKEKGYASCNLPPHRCAGGHCQPRPAPSSSRRYHPQHHHTTSQPDHVDEHREQQLRVVGALSAAVLVPPAGEPSRAAPCRSISPSPTTNHPRSIGHLRRVWRWIRHPSLSLAATPARSLFCDAG